MPHPSPSAARRRREGRLRRLLALLQHCSAPAGPAWRSPARRPGGILPVSSWWHPATTGKQQWPASAASSQARGGRRHGTDVKSPSINRPKKATEARNWLHSIRVPPCPCRQATLTERTQLRAATHPQHEGLQLCIHQVERNLVGQQAVVVRAAAMGYDWMGSSSACWRLPSRMTMEDKPRPSTCPPLLPPFSKRRAVAVCCPEFKRHERSGSPQHARHSGRPHG